MGGGFWLELEDGRFACLCSVALGSMRAIIGKRVTCAGMRDLCWSLCWAAGGEISDRVDRVKLGLWLG